MFDIEAKRRQRGLIRYRCEHDLEYRRIVLEKCKRDTVFFINTFGYTYNPQLEKPTIPFLLYPKQEELIRFFDDRLAEKRRGIFDKSREVGATWLIGAFVIKHWLFVPEFKAGIGSRLAGLVDTAGDPDCIFEKLRMFIKALPEWMQPTGWDRVGFSKTMLIKNPLNQSTITGGAGDEMGRGGRNAIYFLDEAAFIPRSSKVFAALSQNTKCLIPVSTPNGTNNEFYKTIISGSQPHISLHWKDDPRKNYWETEDGQTGQGWDAPLGAIYPWYELQCVEINDPVRIAQELDLDYTASIEGILIQSKWVQAAINAHLKISAIAESTDELIGGLDVATGGGDKSVLTIRRGGMVTEQIKWDANVVQIAYLVDMAMREHGVAHLVFDADGVGAGVSGTLDMIEDKPYQITAFKGGSTEGLELIEWPDGKNGKEKFKNKRASAWYTVAQRFRKTFLVINGIAEYPADELISIPNDPTLITQLSQPTIKHDPTGKILLAPKNLLANSPDEGDSLVYSFNPDLPLIWWG